MPLFARIEGRVVDPTGKPLAGIQIGRALSDLRVVAKTSEPLMVLPLSVGKGPQFTDAQGRFKLAPIVTLDGRDLSRSQGFRTRPLTICFADEEMRRVFFLPVDVQTPGDRMKSSCPARAIRIPIEHTVVIPDGESRTESNVRDLTGGTRARRRRACDVGTGQA